MTNWGPSSWKDQAQSTAETQRQKWYYDQKIGTVDLKPGDLVLVKADALLRERGSLKIGRRMNLMRWCIRSCTWMSPFTKWQTNVDSHVSYTTTNLLLIASETGCSLVCGHLLYMGQMIPVTPQLSQLLRRVNVRLHPERKVVWQSPSIRPAQTSLGWINGEVMTSLIDVHQSIHQGWVKTSGKMQWKWMSTGLCAFGRGIGISSL